MHDDNVVSATISTGIFLQLNIVHIIISAANIKTVDIIIWMQGIAKHGMNDLLQAKNSSRFWYVTIPALPASISITLRPKIF